MVATALLGAGCTEEKIISYRPWFAGLPGAQHATQPVGTAKGAMDVTALPGGKLIIEHDDGSVTLQARTPRHLMVHIFQTLRENQADLFVDQVLSQMTKEQYAQRGLNPLDAFKLLKEHEQDVNKLFTRMPAGARSPDVIFRKISPNVYRLKIGGLAAKGIKWTSMDITMEYGNWRLVWFG